MPGASVSEQCRTCIATLRAMLSVLSDLREGQGRVQYIHIDDELARFGLWAGNIGALHQPESSLSLESRLCEAFDILIHIRELLDDLNEVAGELLDIVSGNREGELSPDFDGDEAQSEETELLEEFGAGTTRLFRVSNLIRRATSKDLFAKALSRNRYRFNDQFDIAHVGEKYPKLAQESAWLQKRLGQAITQRRHYLSYIRDHRGKLDSGEFDSVAPESQTSPTKQLTAVKSLPDSSRPSTFVTKASSLIPGYITSQMLTMKDESDSGSEARSYTTISRSIEGDPDCSTTSRIPKLEDIRAGGLLLEIIECPFCFRMKRFKNQRVWQQHVLADLRTYVCTFPDCDAPYFTHINDWFNHEMQNHRTSYICQLCQSRPFRLRENYLAHVRKQHPDILEDGDEKLVLSIARKPMEQIPAKDCPCCSDWADRLGKQATNVSSNSNAVDPIIAVVPNVFKRHLASHLEQLALFAIPIHPPSNDDNVDSNAAIEEDMREYSMEYDLSSLDFDNSAPSSLASKGSSAVDTTHKSDGADDRDSKADIVDVAPKLGNQDKFVNTPAVEEHLAMLRYMQSCLEAEIASLRNLPSGLQSGLLQTAVINVMASRALTRRDRGQLKEAEELQSQVLRYNRAIHGIRHPDTLISMNHLALTYSIQGKWADAERLQIQVLEARKRALGATYIDTVISMNDLALTWKALGKHEEAAKLMNEFAELRK